jgi:hypothetical protein
MILFTKLQEYLYQTAKDENIVGSKRGERERGKESRRLAE